jgi:hypothetical protein
MFPRDFPSSTRLDNSHRSLLSTPERACRKGGKKTPSHDEPASKFRKEAGSEQDDAQRTRARNFNTKAAVELEVSCQKRMKRAKARIPERVGE